MVVVALLGTLLALGLLLVDVRASGQGFLRPIRASADGVSAAAVRADFPDRALPEEVGVDGQQFYAIARDPWHPGAVAPHLDQPRYRYQRILLPVLAWLLHPWGGGPGLVVALVAVNLAGLLIGALAVGALSRRLGGPSWPALLYPVLPGSLWALLDTTADGLAVSLSLVTVAAFLSGRHRMACLAAVAAVLTRETTILVPLGLVLAHRRRSDLPLIVLPGLVLAGWFALVHAVVPAGGAQLETLVLPFTGLLDAFRARWLQGHELIGMGATVSALVVGLAILVRRHGPVDVRWVIAVHLGFLMLCSGSILGDDFGGTRSTLLVLALASVMLITSLRAPAPA